MSLSRVEQSRQEKRRVYFLRSRVSRRLFDPTPRSMDMSILERALADHHHLSYIQASPRRRSQFANSAQQNQTQCRTPPPHCARRNGTGKAGLSIGCNQVEKSSVLQALPWSEWWYMLLDTFASAVPVIPSPRSDGHFSGVPCLITSQPSNGWWFRVSRSRSPASLRESAAWKLGLWLSRPAPSSMPGVPSLFGRGSKAVSRQISSCPPFSTFCGATPTSNPD